MGTFHKKLKGKFFDKLYENMSETEKRAFYEKLIKEVQVYEERQPNGQWLKSIEFKLPILGEDMKLSLDNSDSVEVCCLLERLRSAKDHIEITIDAEDYYRIKDSEKKQDELVIGLKQSTNSPEKEVYYESGNGQGFQRKCIYRSQ